MRQALTSVVLSLATLLAAGTAPPAAEAPSPVDESALRYYAAQGQTARVEAEARRLARLNPGWHPPVDLAGGSPGGEDEGEAWDLLTADRLAELRAALAARARAEPGWRPSGALETALRRRELRLGVLVAVRAGRWDEAAALVARNRSLGELDVRDPELAFAAAEALTRTGRADDAAAVLRAVMDDAQASAADRTAAVQKAMALLPMTAAEALIARERRPAGGAGEFDAIRVDITRARIAAGLHDEAAAAIPVADREAFLTYARAAPDPNQAGLVAWQALRAHHSVEALSWFKLAIARGGDAMVAHGLAQSLLSAGYVRDAEDVAYAWREPLVHNAILYVDLLETDLTRPNPPAFEPERLARYAEVTLTTSSGEGAQALAWYAYNTCQFDTALDWFRRAVAWHPKEATVYGYALTLRRLRRQRDVLEVVNRYDGLFPKVVGLILDTSREPGPCDPRPVTTAQAAPSLPRVPQPAGDADPALLARRGDLLVAVGPENDLRFALTGAARPTSAVRSRERAAPLQARRVPGVGAMPYERLGGTLLPGWNGTRAPSPVPAAEQPAPAGTLWAGLARPAAILPRPDLARQELTR